jgi:hypothetical protein
VKVCCANCAYPNPEHCPRKHGGVSITEDVCDEHMATICLVRVEAPQTTTGQSGD